jgi:hypothetical protein
MTHTCASHVYYWTGKLERVRSTFARDRDIKERETLETMERKRDKMDGVY